MANYTSNYIDFNKVLSSSSKEFIDWSFSRNELLPNEILDPASFYVDFPILHVTNPLAFTFINYFENFYLICSNLSRGGSEILSLYFIIQGI